MSPTDRPDPSREQRPPITWAATAPGIPIGARGGSSITRADANRRIAGAGIAVRPVGFRELRRVAAIQRRAFPPRLAYTLATLVALWLLPNVRFLVAVRDSDRDQDREVLGCAIGDRNGLDARVINVAVDPPARRLGIAAAMLLILEDDLPGGDMILMVQEENDGAHALYRRLGYADAGTAPGYYGRGRNGIWMRKHRPSAPFMRS